MRQVHFHQEAFTQFTAWVAADPALFERLTRLISEAARNPFEGIGKPEPLKHQLIPICGFDPATPDGPPGSAAL